MRQAGGIRTTSIIIFSPARRRTLPLQVVIRRTLPLIERLFSLATEKIGSRTEKIDSSSPACSNGQRLNLLRPRMIIYKYEACASFRPRALRARRKLRKREIISLTHEEKRRGRTRDAHATAKVTYTAALADDSIKSTGDSGKDKAPTAWDEVFEMDSLCKWKKIQLAL